MNNPAQRLGRPRFLSGWRLPATAITAVAIVGGAAAAAPAATAASQTFNGTVYNHGLGTTAYDYAGGTPTTSLGYAGHLDDGVQVQVVCYVIGQSLVGPNGFGPGGSDYYWDEIVAVNTNAALAVPYGDALIVPDADVYTTQLVNDLVPACDSAEGAIGSTGSGEVGGAAADGGSAAGSLAAPAS